MLERLSDTFVAGVELLEAEGRVVREHASRFASGTALLVAAGLLFVVGVLALATGGTMLLAEAIGVGGALVMVGGALAALAALAVEQVLKHMLK